MQLFSSTKSQFPLFSLNPTPKLPSKLLLRSSKNSSSQSDEENIEEENEITDNKKKDKSGGVIAIRRPVKDASQGEAVEGEEWRKSLLNNKIEIGLSEMAKKMPIFEPERVGSDVSEEKPLGINLELALYRAKMMTKNLQFEEAETLLEKCILFWPEDGRPYVALGKLFNRQSRFVEARSVYERGCQATEGENSYIWQCWAVLENKLGNIRRARELFDASTVADKKHVAAWHGWAILEIKQGNIKKARNLLAKGLKYSGGNEYIYQTLALLEAKANRFEQARYLFQQATKCNPKSCASWLAWAQVEMQQENKYLARQLFEKAIQASPKNRFAWHSWGLFEAGQGYIDKGRKLLRIGHALNPRDPVILQSLALLEYRNSTVSLARALFRRASVLDPRHQPVWVAWGWMEWKEGKLHIARDLYRRALSIDTTTESAARCLQAWGVLEQRAGNTSAARRLFRSSLDVNSESYITWMTWASLEEDQGNPIRAEEIRDLYFQQRTEVVDDASWVMGLLDIFDPALDSIKRLLKLEESSDMRRQEILRSIQQNNRATDAPDCSYSSLSEADNLVSAENRVPQLSDFDVDAFVKDKLSLDASKLNDQMQVFEPSEMKPSRRLWRPQRKVLSDVTQPLTLP